MHLPCRKKSDLNVPHIAASTTCKLVGAYRPDILTPKYRPRPTGLKTPAPKHSPEKFDGQRGESNAPREGLSTTRKIVCASRDVKCIHHVPDQRMRRSVSAPTGCTIKQSLQSFGFDPVSLL